MPWKIEYDEQTRVVETTYAGALVPEEIRAAALATITTGREHKTNLYLGDCLTLEHAGSLFNVYDLVKFLEALNLELIIKEAILLPLSSAACEDLKFYETTARNRGYNVRVFNNRDDAVRWLLDT